MAAVIYLHWTDRLERSSGDGLVLGSLRPQPQQVALSCACMGGIPDPWTLPPTPAQPASARKPQ